MVLLPTVHCLQYILLLLFCSSVLLLLFSCSVISDCDPMIRSTPGSLFFTNSWSWLRLMSIQSVMPSNHLILCCLLFFFHSVFTNIRVFTNESALPIRWPKVWSFNFSIRYSHEYSALIPFRNDWFGPLSVQRTLKSLLQHHNSTASIFQLSAFFTVQHSHPHMTPGKIIALTRHTSFTNVVSLLSVM